MRLVFEGILQIFSKLRFTQILTCRFKFVKSTHRCKEGEIQKGKALRSLQIYKWLNGAE